MDWTLVTAVAGVGLGAAGLVVSIIGQRHERRKATAWEEMAKSQVRIAESLEREVKDLRQEVAGLRTQVGSGATLAHVRLQELEERKRKDEWKKTKDIANGLKWLMGNSE